MKYQAIVADGCSSYTAQAEKPEQLARMVEVLTDEDWTMREIQVLCDDEQYVRLAVSVVFFSRQL